MTRKRFISGAIVLVLLSTVFTSFVFANGCTPSRIDRAINDTITCNQTYYLWDGDFRLPLLYHLDDFICLPDCGNAEIKWVMWHGIPWHVVKYTPDSTCCCGNNTFYVKMRLFSLSKTIKIVVNVDCPPPNPCEIQPVAVNDSYNTTENTCANFSVLDNDEDKHPKEIIVTKPQYGSAEVSGEKIYYCPLGNYCGEDTFTYYYITENNCISNTATVTVTIPCKTPLPETVLYPNLGLETLSIPATGANIISDGKIISALEVIPGTQRVLVEVENRGMVTQAEVKITLQGLPEGVTYTLDPELQKITAHNIGTFSLTITASADVPAGTYPVIITASSLRGSLDKKTINVVIQ